MTVRLRLAALTAVLVAGGVAATTSGLATSVLAHSTPTARVVPVDVGGSDPPDISSMYYAFPAGVQSVAAAAQVAPAVHAPAPAARTIINAPIVTAAPMQAPAPAPTGPSASGPGCVASTNYCGLPTCSTINSPCGLLNAIAVNGGGLGTCNGSGGLAGCGLGANGVGLSDCFFGLGCGLGGFGLGGCGLFSLSGCGLNPIGLGGCGLGGLGFGVLCGLGDDDDFNNFNNFGDCGFFFDSRHHHNNNCGLNLHISGLHISGLHISSGHHSSHH